MEDDYGPLRSMTVIGPAVRRDDAVEVPVVGGVLVVLAVDREADRLLAACVPGVRIDCRITDAGDGWWLASAARCSPL
jgi:hypothetical protein